MPLNRSSQAPRVSPRLAGLVALAVALLGSACSRSFLDSETHAAQGGAGGSGGSSTVTSTSSTSSTSSSSSSGGACFLDSDCADGDECTTDRCENGACVHGAPDDDGDGHAPIACGGDDCNDHNANVFGGHPEICDDGVDNDCNLVADCFDPACTPPFCGCSPAPGGESCANGKDDDCDGLADCDDPKCSGSPACGCAPSETKCDDGIDDDCDGFIDCDDFECASTKVCMCMFAFEDCTNGADDNCNGLIDCKDPACASTGACKCTPGAAEICGNGKDDDCDGLIDCQDPSCIGAPACKECKPEVCDDGLDNDCNGMIDCADPACAFAPGCAPQQEICNNGLDDNHDGKVDCLDPQCWNNPFCVLKHDNCGTAQSIISTGAATYTGDTTGHTSNSKGSCGGDAGEAVFYFTLNQPTKVHIDTVGSSFDSCLYLRKGACTSGKELGCDDDSAGMHAAKLDFTLLYPGTYFVFVDGFTIDDNNGPDEGSYALNVELTPNPPEVCNDGIDNDGDHYVDCADPDCKNAPGCFKCNNGKDPKAEFGPGACTNGEDDDCDGKIDGADSDCHASDYYVTEFCNGVDDNGNGITDDFSCRCAGDADCAELGQLCYTHTAFSCGVPCENILGDICPFVAAGSTCNLTTHQCEF